MIWSKHSVLEKLAIYHADLKHYQDKESQSKISISDQHIEKFPLHKNKKLIPAAVLVPLVNQETGITVLLTKRTNNLNNHAGQISFPGGRVDEKDRNPEHTALRETEEEIGLHKRQIEVVGRLNEYVVGTGFLVSPIIGFIEPPFNITPHENEVAEVFEAPLSFVTHPDNFERRTRMIRGIKRSYFAVQWKDRLIWGATAGMLRDLSQRLWGSDNEP